MSDPREQHAASGPSLAHERTPPQNVDLEMCVLGGIMLEPQAGYPIAANYLTRESFYLDGHGIIFELMGELHGRGIPPDSVALLDELRKRGLLDKAGGSGVVMGMLNSVATGASIEHHSRLVAEKGHQRALIRLNTEIIDEVYRQEKSFEEISEIALASLTQLQARGATFSPDPLSSILKDYMSALGERAEAAEDARAAGHTPSGINGLPTGFPGLDRMLGGLKPGEVTLVAAPTSGGKSAFALNVAYQMAHYRGIPVGYYNLEMDNEQIAARALALASTYTDMATMTKRGCSVREMDAAMITDSGWWSALHEGFERANQAKIYFVSRSTIHISTIRANIGKMLRDQKIKCLIVDYLQILTEEPWQRSMNRTQVVSEFSRGIKRVARDFRIPVVSLSQLNRQIDYTATDPRKRGNQNQIAGSTRRPRLSDLRESGSLEQDADNIIFLHDPTGGAEPTPGELPSLELIVAKNRNGPKGTLNLVWDKQQFWMAELTHNQVYHTDRSHRGD